MLKVILATVLGVFTLICTTTILYWRDATFDPSAFQIFLFLVALPLGLSVILLLPYFCVKWFKYNKSNKEAAQNATTSSNLHSEPTNTPLQNTQLRVFAATLDSAFGQNEQVYDAVMQMRAPELDSSLQNGSGLPLLSFRLTDIDDAALEEETSYLSPLQQRMMLLIESQLQNNIITFSAIAEQLKRSALFYDSELAYEYRMHPAWINPNAQYDDEAEPPQATEVARLDTLHLHVVFADTLLHIWDEATTDEYLKHFFDELGVLAQQVKIEYHYWGQKNGYFEWIELLKQIQYQEHQVSFLLVVDSEIDQETLDDRLWQNEQYIPAEFVSSCCVAATSVEVENLAVIKTLDIIENASNINPALKVLECENLSQFEEEQAFVLVSDDISQAKSLAKVAYNFEQSPIQAFHYVYTYQSLGNTQHLARIYSFLLGLHLPNDLFTFIYSVELPSTQVMIRPQDDEATTEQTNL